MAFTWHWLSTSFCISRDLQKPNLLENSPDNARNNMQSQIKNKKNRGICLWNY